MVDNFVTINDAIEAFKSKGLILKVVEGLQNYSIGNSNFLIMHAWLEQPHLINHHAKNCLKKKLIKLIPHFKNAVIHNGSCRVCSDCWTDLSNKNCWFPKHKHYPTVKDRREESGNKGNINVPNIPDERPVNEEHLLSPFRVAFKFLNQVCERLIIIFKTSCGKKTKCWNT